MSAGELPSSMPVCSLVEDKLYLGARDAAEDEELLKGFEITHILTVDIFPLKLASESSCKLMFLRADDVPEEDLLTHFENACSFIQEGQNAGGCLVHCYFGVSRSATMVIGYIMKKYRLNCDEAFRKVKERRPCIGPNPGFMYQLRLYHIMEYQLNKSCLQYRLYILEKLATTAKRAGAFSAVPDELKSFWSIDDNASGERLKCRKCRMPLFPTSKILPHMQDESVPWWDSRWQDEPGEFCTSSFFVEPTRWLFDQANSLQGKVLCPKCGSKVGNYNWAGLYCECGACVQPGFHITPGRVDRTSSCSAPISPVPCTDAGQSDDSNS